MHVHVQIQGPAEALHDRHGPAVHVRQPLLAGAQMALHLAEQEAHDALAQVVMPREQIPQLCWSRCGGQTTVATALLEEAAVISRILCPLGLPTDLPVARPARAPPLFALDDSAP
jgi:hypothetical protein